MANNTQRIIIEGVRGGVTSNELYYKAEESSAIQSIDPFTGELSGAPSSYGTQTGSLMPLGTFYTGTAPTSTPLWMVSNPKNSYVYVYDAAGSVYTLLDDVLTGLGDLNDGMTASGNGSCYYDNYIYFSTNTTVARYGPLNGTPAFTDDYWSTTLGKTSLTSNATVPYPPVYESSSGVNCQIPNHILHRHSDGKLYIGDTVGNTGTIHFIKTSKTTVEGDTDDGSTYDKLHVGYGLWPTAMETYGQDLAIAFYEGNGDFRQRNMTAKLAFWDTTSDKVSQITWVEFPDSIITAMKNVGGILYVVSGNPGVSGFRLSRFIGGYSFEEVKLFGSSSLPPAGAIYSDGNRLFFGGSSNIGPCTWYYRVATSESPGGLFTLGERSPVLQSSVTALSMTPTDKNYGLLGSYPSFSSSVNGSAISTHAVGCYASSTTTTTSEVGGQWSSQVYRLNTRFRINRVRIPFVDSISSAPKINIFLIVDGRTYTLSSTMTEFVGESVVDWRPINCSGESYFYLNVVYATTQDAVTFPIFIDYEPYDND